VAFAFGDFELDVDRLELRRDGVSVPMEPQTFDVLVYLVEQRERVVTKEELMDNVWGGRFVSETAVTSRIKQARRAVADDGQAQDVIRTHHGRGYRFIAPVSVRSSGPTAVDASAASPPSTDGSERALRQDVRFCRTPDGVRLAYAWTGTGPPLVKAANWLTHVEYDLETPVWRHWYRDLSTGHRLLRYDERGCGLSDTEVDDFSVDAWVDDLETVVDAAGLDRFPLLGVSQGGAVAIEYAVRHPERVTKLVLYGAFVKGPPLRARTDEARREAEMMPELAALGWGRRVPVLRQVFTRRFLPEGPAQAWDDFDSLQVRTVSAQNAARFLQAFNAIDVEESCRRIDVPTLVLHARRDLLLPVGEGVTIASLVPDSRFVSLDSCNHLLLEDEPAWPEFIRQVQDFLAD
jgi:pimeloyl-ACP methyl ester carboxylesterase/DNA-binding winged helix-turn-helix (wHTH) protein